MEFSERVVLRYLGYRGAPADERVSGLIRQAALELEAHVNPKSVYGIWNCRADACAVCLDGASLRSEHLAKHLKGCRRAALLAATLGPGADALIRRYGVRAMEKAVVAQAVSAAMIDAYCDQIQRGLSQTPEAEGLSLTVRFSPGYGDFALIHQEDILRLLDTGKRIGLTLTDGYMLAPSKSVTAVIGFREG